MKLLFVLGLHLMIMGIMGIRLDICDARSDPIIDYEPSLAQWLFGGMVIIGFFCIASAAIWWALI